MLVTTQVLNNVAAKDAPPGGAVNDGTTYLVDPVQSSGRDSVIEVTIIKSLAEADLYNTKTASATVKRHHSILWTNKVSRHLRHPLVAHAVAMFMTFLCVSH